MHPDGTRTSPKVVLEQSTDAAFAGTPREMPEPRVNTRGIGRGRGRGQDPRATSDNHSFRESLLSCKTSQKGNTET
jgi:hypothetical protein